MNEFKKNKQEIQEPQTFQDNSKKSDAVEIPVGKYLNKARNNPWVVSTVILGIILIVFLAMNSGSAQNTVNSEQAAQNVVDFINSNPQLEGEVSLVSSKLSGSFYEIILDYQGQQIPVYATLDGEYILNGPPIPLSGSALNDSTLAQENEEPTASQTSEDDDAVLGDVNAPVTIIEFSDFQCPFCQIFWADTLPQIKEEYIDAGLVKLVYRDYPIPGHPQAQISAEAAECVRSVAGNDEAYFEYHDQLFAKQPQLSEENLKKWAKELGYDITNCLESGQFTQEVESDFVDGGSLGTPTFFINGVKVEGALPFEQFKQIIDSQLA